ncbi:CobW-like GTP-binding protein [Pseudomonas sp. F1_0610]|uniref:CobW family GTP-binding protein n=1 Tax=Pseudomonas sp. F1_0610 TaxID=3114284 RepID=UPI0039C19B8A
MLHENIPTHIVCGQLGVGKTSLLRFMLNNKPKHERWAVLINEFGQIGLDAALLAQDGDGVTLHEVAGGCVCCVNGVPFQVGLTRLLNASKAQRLFIEPSGLGHPLQIMQQLERLPWQQVLALQPLTYVVDAKAQVQGRELTAEQMEVARKAGLVVLNKCDQLSAAELTQVQQQWHDFAITSVAHAQLDWRLIAGSTRIAAEQTIELAQPTAKVLNSLWLDPSKPFCAVTEAQQGWSIGWRWHNSIQFDLLKLQLWLSCQQFLRAKAVVQTNAGCLSFNLTAGQAVQWQTSEWRNDSRIELIFDKAQNQQQLTAELAFCHAQ